MEQLENYVKTADMLDNAELNEKLVEKFPYLRAQDWYGSPMDAYGYVELDDMPIGWRKAFGWEMINEINEAIAADHISNYTILQIKEKFGGLRWYDNGHTDRIANIIHKYGELSEKTCVECGKPAKWMTTDWICPFCDECKEKNKYGDMVPWNEFYGHKESESN